MEETCHEKWRIVVAKQATKGPSTYCLAKHHSRTLQAKKAHWESSFGEISNSRETRQSSEKGRTCREEVDSRKATNMVKQRVLADNNFHEKGESRENGRNPWETNQPRDKWIGEPFIFVRKSRNKINSSCNIKQHSCKNSGGSPDTTEWNPCEISPGTHKTFKNLYPYFKSNSEAILRSLNMT